MSLHGEVFSHLRKGLLEAERGSEPLLNSALRLLCKWRSVLAGNTFKAHLGSTVLGGMFSGLEFVDKSAEGCHLPKILGCYEQPLMFEMTKILQNKYDVILNIGCAEGYYAAGFAKILLNTKIHAFDIDINAQNKCKQLALKNGVNARLLVFGELKHEDFAAYGNNRVLVFCDIEGAEKDLLDPLKAKSLYSMDIVVELHEFIQPGLIEVFKERFEQTHTIKLIEDNGQRILTDTPDWFKKWSHLDQLLAVWEWRENATPWLLCQVKK